MMTCKGFHWHQLRVGRMRWHMALFSDSWGTFMMMTMPNLVILMIISIAQRNPTMKHSHHVMVGIWRLWSLRVKEFCLILNILCSFTDLIATILYWYQSSRSSSQCIVFLQRGFLLSLFLSVHRKFKFGSYEAVSQERPLCQGPSFPFSSLA